jgi:hypothetical protein
MATNSTELLRIGEVSAQVDLPVKTVRYYEDRGLIQASRRSAGGFVSLPPPSSPGCALFAAPKPWG